MTVVEAVRKKVDPRLLASRCKEGNCSVSLDQMSGKFALIHVDVPGDPPWSLAEKDKQRCDYLFVGGAVKRGYPWVIPLELTTYEEKLSDTIVKQLQAGAGIAERLIPKDATVRFCPILASLNLSRYTRLQLGKKWIKFRGKRARVFEMECGERLTEVLRD